MQSGDYNMSLRSIGIQNPEVCGLPPQVHTLECLSFKTIQKQADKVFITLRAKGVNEFPALLTPLEGGERVEAWVSMVWQKKSCCFSISVKCATVVHSIVGFEVPSGKMPDGGYGCA